MPALEAQQLCKSYGTLRAADGVSFHIDAGEIFGLLGPNGAGKSTTINIIATLLRPDSGTVRVAGIPFTQLNAYKRRLGYVPQEISLAPKLTASENLRLVGRLYDLRGAALRSEVDQALQLVGLRERAGDLVQNFSGGMKRRLNIAAALLHHPELLLLDEPTAGVDPQARVFIFETVERLAAEGRAILYTTHYMEEAQRLCSRTAIIDHGRILAMGTHAELMQKVHAHRGLLLQGRDLSEQKVAAVAQKLGGVSFTMNQDGAYLNASGDAALARTAELATAAGIQPTLVRTREPNLETVFLELTGRGLRD